ncbi:MAG: UvrD-helicase domain-containing protein [Bacilli bacterium]|nr:UvrD-helicase domain-containing protein [Bacilli bacterium]
MAIDWSDEQKLAIDNVGHNILVSAGAGSGKTAVLSERIYRLVKKGADITRFLVLTFTNAAAMEMKSRVRDKILEDSELAHLAPDIENSHIETFDAFCLFLVKKYSTVLNLSPSINVIEHCILQIEEDSIIDKVFTNYYSVKDPVFEEMIIRFSFKNDETLRELTKQIINLANLQLDKEEFYKSFSANYLHDSFIDNLIEYEYKNNIYTLLKLKDLCNDLEQTEVAEEYEGYIDTYLAAKNYDELRNLFIQGKPKYKRSAGSELRDYIKKSINSLCESDYGSSEYIKSNFDIYKKYVLLLVSIAKEVDEELVKFQKEHNSFSFSDIAKFAIKLVRNASVCKEVSELFDYILVDEYQDTSDVQEEVITKLSRNNLYMVGDVKQSIYRFRNANCNIFNDKFNNYKAGEGGEEIDLNQSFRSREEIVVAINDIFGQLMTRENNIINYNNGHSFKFGNKGYLSNIQEGANYNVDLATYTLEEGEKAFDKEMAIITSDIIRKINSGYKVVDKKEFRPCTFKDFAIIIDRKTKFDDIKKYFSSKNIPINAIQDESLSSTEITYVTKNLIKLFYKCKYGEYDNEFKHAYCSIARSFLVRDSDRNIYRNIKLSTLSELEISKKIKNVVSVHFDSSLNEILYALYEEFDIYSKIPSLGDCSSGSHKCDVFLGFASNMDSLGYGIKDMYDFFDHLTSDVELSFSDNSNAENAVTLINIHKSKGLEYPIVYFPFLDVKFNRTLQTSSFIADQTYGVTFPVVGRTSYDSLILHLIKDRDVSEDFEEKLRLFYVALTRPREKIVMLANTKKLEKTCFDITKANSFISFISSIKYRKYIADYEITDEKLISSSDKKEKQDIEIKSINIEAKEIVKKKASKQKTIDADDGALDFGTKLHYALELYDFETNNLSYINDPLMKRFVNNVVSSYVFKDVLDAKILHEYKFYDEINNVTGIIDCLILKDDEVDIIDFKLKNISDVHYDEQLNIYADYVKKIITLPIKKYLVSAITGEVREVE